MTTVKLNFMTVKIATRTTLPKIYIIWTQDKLRLIDEDSDEEFDNNIILILVLLKVIFKGWKVNSPPSITSISHVIALIVDFPGSKLCSLNIKSSLDFYCFS